MNQFKKAKTARVNSGKPVEKASDLTTAGIEKNAIDQEVEKDNIAVKNSVDEKAVIETTIIEETKEIEQTNDISPLKAEIDQPVETNLDTTESAVSNPKDIISTQPEEVVQVTIPEPVVSTETTTIPEEQPVQLESPSNPAPVVQENKKEEEHKEIAPVEVPTYVEPVISTPILETTVQTTVTNQQSAIYQTPPSNQIVSQAIGSSTPMIQQPINPVVNPVFEAVVEPIPTIYHQPQEPIHMPVIKDTPVKKSAPNIFHNKGESKSVRKSLVLKPTSVKIAETYCNKNGGSFNELIQHLLDNFIDEYGLR